MVMTFVLHPLSHYNSITEPCAQFLLSLLEDISIDFPSHFILFLINVYRDTATRDKLIFSFGYHADSSPFFHSLSCFSLFFRDGCHRRCYRSTEAQLRPRRPQTQTATPPTSSPPSTSAPFSSAGGVTLDTIMAQLQRMDTRLDTLSDELC